MAKERIGRPTKVMMEAVNLALGGKEAQAMDLLKNNTHDQHTKANLQHFTKVRQDKGLGPYDPDKPRARKGARTVSANAGDVEDMIDGRTRLGALIRLEARIQELLATKDKKEVAKVRDAMKNVEKLRQQLEEAEALIG